jgi:hypothetical protein
MFNGIFHAVKVKTYWRNKIIIYWKDIYLISLRFSLLFLKLLKDRAGREEIVKFVCGP